MASAQKGVVHLGDVRAAGLDKRAVSRRVDAELMRPMFANVWAWGHGSLTREAWFLGATLSAGEGTLLDAVSACQNYGLFERRVGRVHVVSPRRSRDQPRLKIRYARPMPPGRLVNGIPTVAPAEALLGLAASPASDRDLRRAVRQAQVRRLATFAELRAFAAAAAGRPGIRRFRTILGATAAATKSDLEDAARDLFRRYGLPEPASNLIVAGEEADLCLPGIVIELDSEGFHDNSIQAADDARRHALWEAAGYVVIRLTWDDIHVTPVRTVRRLRRALLQSPRPRAARAPGS